jgi:hypothetical protein
MFQRLGIGTLVSILKNPRPPVEDEGPENQDMSMSLRQMRDVKKKKKKSARCKFSSTILLCV